MLPEGTEALIERALAEDLGEGDHTTRSTIPASARGAARLIVKQDGVLAGVELAEAIARQYDPDLSMKVYILDGAAVHKGDIAFTLQTSPGLRGIEKWAVRIGGGQNHRMGLYDMLMIKDNHADFAGGIPQAVIAAKAYLEQNGLDLPIEVETRNLEEVESALAVGGIQRIMLDNFEPALLRTAVELIAKRFETEASGGIVLSNIRAYAETGVDFISVGALTHSVPSLDLSLKAVGA